MEILAAISSPAQERRQAEAVVKASVLCMARGIARAFRFEGRGPAYSKDGDFGLLLQI